MVWPRSTCLSCSTPTLLLGASGRLTSCSWRCRGPNGSSGGIGLFLLLLLSFGTLFQTVRQAPSLSAFKTRLKTHFYSLAFNSEWDPGLVLVPVYCLISFIVLTFYLFYCIFYIYLFLLLFITPFSYLTLCLFIVFACTIVRYVQHFLSSSCWSWRALEIKLS